jgi:hypothetical protein
MCLYNIRSIEQTMNSYSGNETSVATSVTGQRRLFTERRLYDFYKYTFKHPKSLHIKHHCTFLSSGTSHPT